MKKTLIIFILFGTFAVKAQNVASLGCGGIVALPISNTTKFITNGKPDTVYLQPSSSINIRANYDYNCKLQVINLTVDWIRNDTLIASGTPTYNIGSNGYSILNINMPGVYKTFFKGYYNSPADGGTDLLYVISAGTTGITEHEEEDLNISPIPSCDNLNIKFSSNMSPCTVNVYNSLGELVKTDSSEKDVYILATSELSNGVYFITIGNKYGFASRKKFIVKH